MWSTETPLGPSASDEDTLVAEWRARQLQRLGISPRLSHRFAHVVDWHEVAALVARGCPAELAIDIVR